jgi:hypothetical protein
VIRREALADRKAAERTLRDRERGGRIRERADLSDAYGFVRQALRAADRAALPRSVGDPVFAALHVAEDRLREAVKTRTRGA